MKKRIRLDLDATFNPRAACTGVPVVNDPEGGLSVVGCGWQIGRSYDALRAAKKHVNDYGHEVTVYRERQTIYSLEIL